MKIKTFQQFESIRDLMTPKSDEDIYDAFEEFSEKLVTMLIDQKIFDNIDDAYDFIYKYMDELYDQRTKGDTIEYIVKWIIEMKRIKSKVK